MSSCIFGMQQTATDSNFICGRKSSNYVKKNYGLFSQLFSKMHKLMNSALGKNNNGGTHLNDNNMIIMWLFDTS